MEQRGKIVYIDRDIAKVTIARSSACGDSCSSCGGECSPSEVTVSARIKSGNVGVGDVVEIKGSTKKLLLSASLAYVLPLILLIAGTMIGSSSLEKAEIENYEVYGFLIGLVGLVVSFFIIRVVGNKMTKDVVDFEVSKVLIKKR